MMKQITFIGITLTAGTFIFISCNTKHRIDGLQGKVKMETIAIAPKVPGRIAKIFVSEGQIVHTGDTIAILDVPEINAKMEQTNGAVESAQAQLDMAYNGATQEQIAQIDGQLDAANQQLLFAEQSYKRMQNMLKDSLISAQQFDEVSMKYKAAKAQVRTLQAKKQETVIGSRPEIIRMAKGQLVKAKGAKNEVESADNERYIIAPADMRVETISLKQGELALPGYTLINGYQNKSIYFRFIIPESKINAFRVGQEVIVEVPFVHISFTAKIAFIKQMARYADNSSASPSYELGETTYEIKAVPENTAKASDLFQNSTVLLKIK
jgi:HlyD family secretion protein